jgi:hypothetical protein
MQKYKTTFMFFWFRLLRVAGATDNCQFRDLRASRMSRQPASLLLPQRFQTLSAGLSMVRCNSLPYHTA